MFKIESGNINYLAKIVSLNNLRKHSNADRLQCVSIDGNNVITDLSAKDGDIYVFFPLECAINKDFLSWSNSFEDKDMNADKEQKGFFNKHGRVRAIRLRGERSEGYIVPAQKLFDWLGVNIEISSFIGTEFDTYGDILICEKYIPKKKVSQGQNKSNKKLKRESKIISGQFRLSEDTAHFKKNLDKFSPEDIITVSYKMHGCNTSLGKVLCKRKLSVVDKIAKFFGAKVEESVYDLVYASRRVIKSDKYID